MCNAFIGWATTASQWNARAERANDLLSPSYLRSQQAGYMAVLAASVNMAILSVPNQGSFVTFTGNVATQPRRLAQARAFPSGP